MTRALALASLLAAAACHNTSSNVDADDGTYNCAAETRADVWGVPLVKMGAQQALEFQLMSATPSPPARGDNTWVVQINTMTAGVVGAPMTGATLNATPYMPDHQHGTPKQVLITAMPTAGQYQLSPVNMWMPGLWQTTVLAKPATAGTGPSDTAVFSICIPN